MLIYGTPAERTITCVYSTSVGVSGSWFLRRETSSYSISRSLQVPARRLEAPAVGVSGSWFLRRETSSYSTKRDRQATTLLIRSSCSKMHFIQTPWLVIQCSGKFFDKKLRVPPRLTLGLGNEYFCRPQPSKRQKCFIWDFMHVFFARYSLKLTFKKY